MTALDNTTGEVRRELSAMERWYWICDQISPVTVVARVLVRGECTTDDLTGAAAALVARHPLLRVAVRADADGGDPRFVAAVDPVPPVRTVRLTDPEPDRWVREVDDTEFGAALEHDTGPLARIVHIEHPRTDGEPPSHDVLLAVSHVVADGTTALAMLRDLVLLAAGEVLEPRPALPAPEALLPRRVGRLPRALHAVLAVLADGVAGALARPRRLHPAVAVDPRERRTRLVHRTLDAEGLDALARRCRDAGVSVHAAIVAATARAVAELDATSTGARRVTVGSPVDLRAALVPPVGPDDAGAYVATVPSHVPVVPGADLWATARAAHRDLRRRRRHGQHVALVSLLRVLSPSSVARSGRTVGIVDRSGPGNVCVSNLGRHPFPERAGDWVLDQAQFAAAISISGLLVLAVTTTHGALHCNVTHIEGAVERASAERVADHVMSALKS